MKERIKTILEKAIGLTLTRTTRAANMECLKFGQLFITVKGEELNIGEFGIHLQCPWRITKGQEILIGSFDVYEQPDQNAEYEPDFDWDRPNGNLRDIKLNELIENVKLTVEKIEADDIGGVEIIFNDNYKLTTFPASSTTGEYWRLLDNRPNMNKHFVVSGEGIWESA